MKQFLINFQVYYFHDVSYSLTDRIVFEMELSSTQAVTKLPAHLQQRQRFVFQIKIEEDNDPPLVSLSNPSQAFTLARGSEKRLSADLFQIQDPDSHPADITFKVLPSESRKAGYLRNKRYPSPSIDEFTLADLQEDLIFYVDLGEVSESRIGFKISDRDSGDGLEDDSQVAVVTLRIQTFKLSVVEVNNTGLSLAVGASSLITPYNLTFTSNAGPEQGINIR